MKILINERLSEHRCKTPEGYLICTDAILARTGKQTYRKNEIFKDSDDETEIEVDRTEDEVFAPQTLASFENKPVTVEHPDEDVNVHNYKEYAVGFVRDVHRGEVNGQPVILGNLVITDEQTIQEIENGEHTDLSCGYDCDIADEANPCQRNIRGNHVALCECGRAGIARIVDSKCKDFDDTTKNIRVVKEFIEQNGNKFDKRKDADAILEYIKKRTGIANADYGDVLYIIKEYTRAEIIDSVKDARMKVANLTNGYAIVPASRWRKFGLNSEVERFTTNLDEARYIRSSLERNDGISFIIVDVTQRRTTDSMKDTREIEAFMKDSDTDVDKLQQLIAETLSARADAWRNDKQKEIRQAKENIANAIGAEQDTRRDIKEFHTLPEYVRRIAEKKARSELKQYDYLLNIQNKIYEKYSSLMREAESLAKTIEAKYNVKLNLELNRSGGEREAIRILKTMRKQSDSLKDALIPPTKKSIDWFESLLRISNIEIERKGLTMFGRVHYQVRAFMPFNQFVKKLDRIDNEMNKLGIRMTFNAGADDEECTAGIDLDEQHINDAIHDSPKEDVARILKPLGLTYTTENVLFAWNDVLIRSFEFNTSKDAKLAFNALQSELHGKYKPRLVQNTIHFSESYDVKLKEKLLNDIKSAGGKDIKLSGSEFGNDEVGISIEVSNTDDIADIVNKLSKNKNYHKVEQKKVFGGKIIISAVYNYADLYKLIHDSAKAQKIQKIINVVKSIK